MRVVTQESLAAQDLRGLVEFLASRDNSVALRFINAVEAAYLQISDNPSTGSLWGFKMERLKKVRVKVVPGFPNHLIFFRELPQEVRVLRVLHAARDISGTFGE